MCVCIVTLVLWIQVLHFYFLVTFIFSCISSSIVFLLYCCIKSQLNVSIML
ncbi:hypothetical protein HanHA89_Chr08g0298051 [Helianthus annuus]|nr:hypothetical protein HanHA89_Chr08g0298051 [Helianthus annuus]